MNNAMTALDTGFAVESPSGVYSLSQKLTSLLEWRMVASSVEHGLL
jgi:hypothetical protein